MVAGPVNGLNKGNKSKECLRQKNFALDAYEKLSSLKLFWVKLFFKRYEKYGRKNLFIFTTYNPVHKPYNLYPGNV